MISTFILGGSEFRRTADLHASLPIGATIGSGVKLTDPADPRNRLRVVAVHYSLSTGNVRYEVVPS